MLELWHARAREGRPVWKWAGWEERYEFRAITGTRTYSCARIVVFPNSNTREGSLTVPGRLDCLSGLALQLPSQQSPIASSSSLASISTPVDKVECVEIRSLYLGNGSSVGLASLQASTQHGMCVKFYPCGQGFIIANSIFLHTWWQSKMCQDSPVVSQKLIIFWASDFAS